MAVRTLSSPVVERHYVIESSTQNLRDVSTEIPRDRYDHIARMVEMIGQATERAVGTVRDQTRFYEFHGSCVFLPQGVVQVGQAETTDNRTGFGMVRMFANDLDAMHELEQVCGVYGSVEVTS